jgi:hypothetical protein
MNDDKLRASYLKVQAFSSLAIAIGTGLLALIGAGGLYFIVDELEAIHGQNVILESSIRESYRPIGIASDHPETDSMGIIEFKYSKEKLDRFAFMKTYYFENNAEGVLVYIGQISFVDSTEIDFRSAILSGEIESVNVDLHYSHIRETPIFGKGKRNLDRMITSIMWEDLIFSERYYVYVLFFYEDQNGNLYDTEHMDVYPFKKAEITGSYVIAAIDTAGPLHRRERYHYYNKDERLKLVEALENIRGVAGHPIIEYIRE